MERWIHKFISIFVTFTLPFLAILLPYVLHGYLARHAEKGQLIVGHLMCFGGGIFFSTYLLHMGPEVRLILHDSFLGLENIVYPIPDLMIGVGFFFVLLMEKTIIYLHNRKKKMKLKKLQEKCLVFQNAQEKSEKVKKKHGHLWKVKEGKVCKNCKIGKTCLGLSYDGNESNKEKSKFDLSEKYDCREKETDKISVDNILESGVDKSCDNATGLNNESFVKDAETAENKNVNKNSTNNISINEDGGEIKKNLDVQNITDIGHLEITEFKSTDETVLANEPSEINNKSHDLKIANQATIPQSKQSTVNNSQAYQSSTQYGSIANYIPCYNANPRASSKASSITSKSEDNSDTLSQNSDEEDHHQHSHHQMRSLILVLALSLHHLFEGLTVGLQMSVSLLWTLVFAVMCHESIISFSVGLNFVKCHYSLKKHLLASFLVAIIMPIGLAIGTAVSESGGHSTALDIASGFLQAFSTGTFLYVTFFEIFLEELNPYDSGIMKVCSALAGFIVMALLMIVPENSMQNLEMAPVTSTDSMSTIF